MCGFTCGLYSVPLNRICIWFCARTILFWLLYLLKYSLRLKSMILSAFFFPQYYFWSQSFLLPYEFSSYILFFCGGGGKAVGILTRIRLYLYISLSSIDILIIFLKSYGYSVSFHLFVMSSISFISQKQQNDLCSFPGQTIQYHSNPSLCLDQ